MDVIEHIEDDKGYFRSLFEAARPGAAFLLTVPADPALWSPHDEAVGHQRRYTPEALAALWEGLPAEQLLLAYFNWFLLPLIALARAVNRRRGRVASSSGTDFDMPPALLNRLLAWIMTSERGRLVRLLANPRARGFRRGVSLVGVIRKAV
jgi:hypothetical protein